MLKRGIVAEVWRFPVTSVGGEIVASATLTSDGLEGDRHYGLIDATDGSPAAPERDPRWRKALHLTAKHVENGIPILTFPDGGGLQLDDRTTNEALSDHFGFHVEVAAYEHTSHPAAFPISRYRHPHFPVHLLTTSSLECLRSFGSAGAIESRRFRPTVLVATTGEGFVENKWVGSHIDLGPVELAVHEGAKRCGMTFLSQPGLDEDPEILRNILRHNGRNLGIYCTVEQAGSITVGDEVLLHPVQV